MVSPPAQWGAFGVLLFVVFGIGVMIYRGYWVPRRIVDDIRADRDARIAELVEEANRWRDAWQSDHDVLVQMSGHMNELLEFARGSAQALQSLTYEARQR